MPTKSEEIFRVLEEQIICCDLEPGTSLFEVELSDRFHVSRTPIREALLKLERRGLICSVPYKGFAVNPVSIKDVFELYELRILIEVYNAGVAAQKMDGRTARRLEALLQRSYDDNDQESKRAFMRDDHTFHLSLAAVNQNNRIEALLSDILKHLQRVYYLGFKKHVGQASPQEHREIMEAILAGDEANSKRLMEKHIRLSKQRILGALE